MDPRIRIAEGFHNQIFVAVPPSLTGELSRLPLTEGLYVTIAGYFPQAHYHYKERPQGCEDHILIFCSHGAGWCRLGRVHLALPPQHVVIIPARVPHAYGASQTNPWSIYWAHFRGHVAPIYVEHLPEHRPCVPVHEEVASNTERLFRECFSWLQRDLSINTLVYASSILEHTLRGLLFGNPSLIRGAKAAHSQTIDQSIQFMRNHIDTALTLYEVAREAQLSIPHFSRLFRARTGSSPMDYFLRLRIQRACQYLMTCDRSVRQIGRLLGYEDPYYFSRIFRKVMGISPTQYRTHNRV